VRKIPISGGPHTGKTTLVEALRSEFTEAYFVPEPAETVISRELAKQALNPDYIPIVPWIDYSLFAPEVAKESLALEADIPSESELVFQDRSLIDTVAYCRLNGLEDDFVPGIKNQILLANYAIALFCEPVGIYTATDVRRETAEEAKRTHDFLAQAYDESGIQVIHLPAVPVPERIELIRSALS
jgi:predicted ATPase